MRVSDSLALAAGPGDRPAAAAGPARRRQGLISVGSGPGPGTAGRHVRLKSTERAPARGPLPARPRRRARARHAAGRRPRDGASPPGAGRRACGGCQAARRPRRLVRALHALRRARSQLRARHGRRTTGWTSPAAPICSAARRPCAQTSCPPAPPGAGCSRGDRRGARRRLGGRPVRRVAPIVPPGGARVALAPLSVAALRLEPDTLQMLERLGLERIEGLYPLPRRALVARFGDAPGPRGSIRRFAGRRADLAAPPTPCVSRPADLRRADRGGLGAGAGDPAPARRAVQRARGRESGRPPADFWPSIGSTTAPPRSPVGTSRPCRDARQLERLFAPEKLERVDLGFGIERAVLEATEVEPLLPEPLAWRAMGAGDLDQARDLAPLVDRLSNRLGPGAVRQLAPRASHLPERAQARVPALSPGSRCRLPFPSAGAAPARPLRLLARPEPIEAVAPLPDEPPVLFRWRRAVHKVGRCAGRSACRPSGGAAGCRSGARDPRLLRGRGRRGRPLLAVPRGPLRGRRGHAAVVPPRPVRLADAAQMGFSTTHLTLTGNDRRP